MTPEELLAKYDKMRASSESTSGKAVGTTPAQTEAGPQTGFAETKSAESARVNSDAWRKAALPVIGAAAGAVGGPMLGAAMGIARPVLMASLGEMAGGGLGEIANQALGITEPSGQAVALNTLAPAIGRVVGAIPQGSLRLLPDSVKAIRAGLVDQARAVPNMIRIPESSRALYGQLPAQGSAGSFRLTSFPESSLTSAQLQADLNNPIKPLASKTEQIRPVLEQFDQLLSGTPAQYATVPPGSPGGRALPPGTGLPSSRQMVRPAQAPGIDFDQLITIKEDLGRKIATTADPETRGAYKQMYRSILADLENLPAPAGTAVDTWRKAQVAYKRELAKHDLTDAIEKSIQSKEGVDALNADQIVNFVKNNNDFRRRMDPHDLDAIESHLRDMASYTGKRSNKLLTILAGTAIGGGAGGAAAGYVAADVIASALMKPGARKLLTKLVTANQGRAGRDAGAILAAGVAGALGNDPNKE